MKRMLLLLFFIIYFTTLNIKFSFGQILTFTVDSVPANVAHVCVNNLVTLGSYLSKDTLLNSSFDNHSLGKGWSGSNVVPLFTNPCSPITLPASGAVCLFGYNIYPRLIMTDSFNIIAYQSTQLCKIEWDMAYATGQDLINCEPPDEPNEGVHLQYTTTLNAPYTWYQVNNEIPPTGIYGTSAYTSGSGGYWTPVSGNVATGPYYKWNHYSTPFPVAAYSSNTRFRWCQELASGNSFDHWGIDNVKISCPSTYDVEWRCIELHGWLFVGLNPYPQIYTNVGTYHYVVTITNLTTGNIFYDTLTLYVDTAATVGTLSGPNTVTVWQSNVKYTLSNYSSNTTFTWTYPSGAMAIIDSNSITLLFSDTTQSGLVAVKASNGCGIGDSASIYVTVLNGNSISEASQVAYDLKVFPNPLNNTATISYNLKNTQHLNISIYDITGRKVKELLNTKQQKGTHQLSFDASYLSAATYFLQLTGDDVLNPVKFTIIH